MSTPCSELPGYSEGYVILSEQQIVRISGADTNKFVQGQFSQHVDEITQQQSLRAAACTPKGRAYCLTRLVRDQEDLLLDLDSQEAQAVLTQLRKYLMLFRGTSMEVLEEGRIIGLIGENAARSVAGEDASIPSFPGQMIRLGGDYLISLEPTAEGTARYQWWQLSRDTSPPEQLESLCETAWNAASIAAGVPWLTENTRGGFVPQMLNLQHLQGIHFKKGCYTGQEVIARMHFLGQLKKSLFRLQVDGAGAPPTPGTRLLHGTAAVGEIINSTKLSDDRAAILAVIRHTAQDQPLTLEGSPNASITWLPLPYEVPERENIKTDT